MNEVEKLIVDIIDSIFEESWYQMEEETAQSTYDAICVVIGIEPSKIIKKNLKK